MTDRRSPHRVSTSGVRAVETLVYSFSAFVKDVFAVQDILQVSYFHVEDTETSLSEPLNGVVQGNVPRTNLSLKPLIRVLKPLQF